MPGGITHNNFHKAGMLIHIPVSGYLIIKYPTVGVGYFVGYMFGRYISPDWDIVGMNKDESKAIKELKIFGYILYALSSFYGAVFHSFHRSFITHFPGVSTFIRMLFIFAIPLTALWYYDIIVFNQIAIECLFGFWLGLSNADYIHWCADMIWKEKDDELKLRIFEKRKKK